MMLCCRLAALFLMLFVGSPFVRTQEQKPVEKPKPKIKGMSVLGVARGKTTLVIVFGDNLAPTGAMVDRPGFAAKLVGPVEDTKEAEKARASKRVVVEITPPVDCLPDTYTLTLAHTGDVKATVPLVVWEPAATELEIKKPTHTFALAMPLSGSSVAVTGAIADADNPDVYRLDARTGETWRIELLAGRGGSAMDPILRLRDEKHLPLALDAGSEKQDRRITFTAPSNGGYFIQVSDAEVRGGPTFTYRLTVRRQ